MEILQHQDAGGLGRQGVEAIEGGEGIAAGLPLAAGQAAQARDEIPHQQAAVAQAPGRPLQQGDGALLLAAADPEDRRAGADQ